MRYKTFLLITFFAFLVLSSSILVYGIATRNLLALLVVPLLIFGMQLFQYANEDDYHGR